MCVCVSERIWNPLHLVSKLHWNSYKSGACAVVFCVGGSGLPGVGLYVVSNLGSGVSLACYGVVQNALAL